MGDNKGTALGNVRGGGGRDEDGAASRSALLQTSSCLSS